MPVSDADLVAAARRGRDPAFGQLAVRYSPALRSFLRGVCRDHALADDLAQEALIRAWRNLDRLNDAAAFKSWLFGIGWRLASEERRATGRRLRRETDWSGMQDQVRPEGVAPEEAMALEDALAALAPDERACIALCLAGNWSHGDAATVLDMPLGTVKSHIKRGRAKLLAALGDEA